MTTSLNLHSYYKYNPANINKNLETTATLQKVAAIVSVVSFTAIASVALYFTVMSLLSYSLVFLGLSLTTPLLAVLSSKVYQKGQKNKSLAEHHKSVIEEIKLLNGKSDAEIKEEFNDFGINIEKIIKNTKKVNKNFNLQNVIIPFAMLKNHARHIFDALDIRDKLLHKRVKTVQQRAFLLNEIHRITEKDILKRKIFQAEVFHVIINPTSHKTLKLFGNFYPLSFNRRYLFKIYDKKDEYFVFHHFRKPLSSDDIANLSFKDISKRIFD